VAQQADIFIVIGTSLSVYPAAGLLHAAAPQISKFLVDPGDFDLREYENVNHIQQNAVAGMGELMERLDEFRNGG
jgi:NAD-dependent deacetylase